MTEEKRERRATVIPGLENKEQGRPPIRPHLWAMENIRRDDRSAIVEYDLRCSICGEVKHIEQPPLEFCPGSDPDDS